MIYFRTFTIVFFLFLSFSLKAQYAEDLTPGFYFGYIEEVYPIAFNFKEEESQLIGSVIFPLNGDSVLIEVDYLGDRYLFTEFDPGQAAIGFYFFKKEGEYWSGYWQNREGKQNLNIRFKEADPESDWRKKLMDERQEEKWFTSYRLKEGEKWTNLTILRQAGRSANAVLSHQSKVDGAIFFRGDCQDIQCRNFLFLNQSGDEDLLLEVNLNGNELAGYYFFEENEVGFSASITERIQVRTKYSFNQWFVFDALYPDVHPLMAIALEERIADWMSSAVADWHDFAAPDQPTVWDRFSSRNYVWTEILHFDENYLSGYIEWIQNNESKKMNSFLFDQQKQEWYWGEAIVEMGLSPIRQAGDTSLENGVVVIVPGGWQKISPMDRVLGRSYQYYQIEDQDIRIPRTFRKWFKL